METVQTDDVASFHRIAGSTYLLLEPLQLLGSVHQRILRQEGFDAYEYTTRPTGTG